MFRILIRKYSIKAEQLSKIKQKVDALPGGINTNLLDLKTLNRIGLCSNDFLTSLVKNLTQYGIKDKHLCATLETYENWNDLTKDKIEYVWNMFRECSLNNEIYAISLSKNPKIIEIDKKYLTNRLNDFKDFLTRKYLERALVRSPDLLTCNLDLFRYKYSYVFAFMGIEQAEMCSSYVFSHSIEHIRERHIFLLRSGLYDKPNKKGETKVENPKLSFIVDTHLKEFLKLCTKNMFSTDDYSAFSSYLKEENFDNELLGSRIGKLAMNQILDSIRQQKRIDREQNDFD